MKMLQYINNVDAHRGTSLNKFQKDLSRRYFLDYSPCYVYATLVFFELYTRMK